MEEGVEARKRLDAAGGAPVATDWRDAVFFNLAVDPTALQPFVPYPLDLYEGAAYVSIVAFDQIRFRTRYATSLLSPLIRPLGSYLFCNLRAYVRYGGEPGVFFMREWVPNPVSPFLVAPAYGLPQRPAQVHYEHDRAAGLFFGHVTARGLQLTMSARIDYGAPLEVPTSGSLDDFLMERYSGFQTPPWGRARFRIWHVPWPQRRIEGEIQQDALLRSTGGWYETARLATANFSPGVDGVEIGWPLPA